MTPSQILGTNILAYANRIVAGKTKRHKDAMAKHVSIYLLKHLCPKLTLCKIAKIYGYATHHIIILSIRKIEQLRQIDDDVQSAFEVLYRVIVDEHADIIRNINKILNIRKAKS